MDDLSWLAVGVGTVAGLVIGGLYYGVLGDRLAAESGPTPAMTPAKFAVELARCFVLAFVVAGLSAEVGVDDLGAGLLLGLVLWVGFPLVLWVGAVVHEGTRPALAVIHAGDWLIKLLALGLIAAALG